MASFVMALTLDHKEHTWETVCKKEVMLTENIFTSTKKRKASQPGFYISEKLLVAWGEKSALFHKIWS